MSTEADTGTTLTIDGFWVWLKRHANCIIQASGQDAHLYDSDELHWHLSEEPDRMLAIQLILGKRLLAEILVPAPEVLFVQSTPDPEDEQAERFLFELIGGPKEKAQPICTFLMAHGYDEQQKHGATLKH